MTTPRFELVAEIPSERAVEVARQVEAFSSIVEASLPASGRASSLQPALVVAFATERSFSLFTPVEQGRTAPVAAFVALDETAPCLAFHLERGEQSYRTVFHEHARVLLRRAPLWFMEGASEVYSTLGATDDARRVRVGGPVALNRIVLRDRSMPLAELLQTTRAKPGPEGQVFYAQSWALAHYLLLGNEALSVQVPVFLALAAAGSPPVRAFEETFGAVADVERELGRYVERGSWPSKEYPLPEAAQAVPMTPPEIDAVLGRLLFQAGRDGEAEGRLRRALAANPSLFDAHLTLGALRLRQARDAEALDRLEKARALAPGSVAVAYHLARAALRSVGSVEDERLEAARAGLEKLLAPSVRSAEPWAVLGTLSGRFGRLEEAERALRRSLDLAPGRLQTVAELADVLVVQDKFDEAERLLDSARDLATRTNTDLGPWRERVARERGIARIRADLAKAAGLDTPTAGAPAERRRTGRWLLQPDYRATGPGEERTHGLLQRIDCEGGRVVVHVATAGDRLRFTAKSLAGIQAISYREGFEPLLACGPRRETEPVFVTWRPGDGAGPGPVRGTVVALEFLGEEYLPR